MKKIRLKTDEALFKLAGRKVNFTIMPHSTKPIKRSEALAPLSREHHEGLLFVWKIRQGLRKQTAVERIAAYVQWFWENDLQPHFEKEENALLPFLSEEYELKSRLLNEHRQIRELISEVNKKHHTALLETLAQTVNDHIRFEERILFNHLQETLSQTELSQIATQLTEEKNCPVWQDEFWLNK